MLEDLDTGKRRSMRTTASYVFRGASRRFRVTVEPRTGPAVLVSGLELANGGMGQRGNGAMGLARFALSADASVDLELLSPAGRVAAVLARGRACAAGLNQVSWRGALGTGVYLLRATATTEDGASVLAARPVVVVR